MHLFALWFALLRLGPRAEAWDDETLVRRAISGQRAAQAELARRVGPYIRARVLRVTRGRPVGALDVDDLIQEVWSRLFERGARRLRDWDPAKGMSLAGYVNLVAGQVLVTAYHHQHAQKRAPEGGVGLLDEARAVAGDADVERAAVERERLVALWAHLDATLAPMGRLVLKMLFVDQQPPAVIAEALGVKRATVDSWRFKIKRAAQDWEEARKIEGAALVGFSGGPS